MRARHATAIRLGIVLARYHIQDGANHTRTGRGGQWADQYPIRRAQRAALPALAHYAYGETIRREANKTTEQLARRYQ